jgi:predicted Zn-dependent peptidase
MDRHVTLDNRLQFVTHTISGMESAAIGIWVKTGGRYETEDHKGISHFLEHLLFKGSKKYTCRQIKESIEGIGGMLNAFTSEEATCFLAKIPVGHLEIALDVLSDMVLHPLLAQEDIDKERTVILEEIKMYKDLPQHYVYDVLDRLLWPAQPLGASIIGTAESVSRLQRADIEAYKKLTYTSANIVIAACGAFPHAKVVDRIKKKFRSLKGAVPNTFAAAFVRQDAPQLDLLIKETEQTHLALGFHSFKRDHPLKHAAFLLHIIMGGNMSSRLFNAVREDQGLAYEIGTQLKRFQDTGSFIVHAGIDNRKVTAAMELILAELKGVTNRLVCPDEFRRAKEFSLGQLALTLEDTMNYMLWIGESMVSLAKTYTLKDIIKEVSQVTREDIRRAAEEIFKNNAINCALIGPAQLNREAIYQTLRI